MGLAGQPDCLWNAAQVVFHDHHVGNFHGGVGIHAAHGEAYARTGKCLGIMDTDTGHGHIAIVLLHFLNGGKLGYREQQDDCAWMGGHFTSP